MITREDIERIRQTPQGPEVAELLGVDLRGLLDNSIEFGENIGLEVGGDRGSPGDGPSGRVVPGLHGRCRCDARRRGGEVVSGQVCECGHTSEEHAPSAKVRVTPRPCLVAGCGCEHFHAARPDDEPKVAA